MHPSSTFRVIDPIPLAALVAERGLALIIGAADGRPLAAHAPVLLEGPRLRFHLSAGNALAAALAPGGAALAVVTGPEAYVSPDWYGLEDQVPTWNYLSVEMEGEVALLDQAGTVRLLDEISATFEARLAPKLPWTRDKMGPGRFDAMLKGIRAFEMRVTRLEGVWKLGQHKGVPAIEGVARALDAQPDQGAKAIAALMRDQAAMKTLGSRQ
jgi:transcriptional regulator